jgi:hypothetical protein
LGNSEAVMYRKQHNAGIGYAEDLSLSVSIERSPQELGRSSPYAYRRSCASSIVPAQRSAHSKS